MPEQTDIQNNEIPVYEKAKTRNKETFCLLCLLYAIWVLPYITASEAGGLANYVFFFLAALSLIGALILFLPMRWLVRLSMDGKKKTLPRIAILLVIAAVITYTALNITPTYVSNMEYEANKYYTENPHEFTDPYEGKIIRVFIFSGPYDTYFVYTNDDPPRRRAGGVIIDYKNGWYFSGVFIPN